MQKENPYFAIAAFKVKCLGATPDAGLRNVDAVVIVAQDSTKKVSCPLITEEKDPIGVCQNNNNTNQTRCKYLDGIWGTKD